MDSWQIGNLFYLVLLGSAVLMWFIAENRNSLGKTLRMAMVWIFIFIGVIAAYGLWNDVRSTVVPRQTVMMDEDRIEVPKAPDGHYYLTLAVNDTPVEFVVDTGATGVVLTKADAQRAGINLNNLQFFGQAYTANGPVRTAPVRLDQIGPFPDRNFRAWVNEGEMDQSLLGMTYLQRFETLQISNGRLILIR